MEMIETLRGWLLTYPGWGSDTLVIGPPDGRPGSAGLMFQSLQEQSRQVAISGNTLSCYRLEMTLQKISVEDITQWLLELQEWVDCRNTGGKLPVTGQLTIPEIKLLRRNADGSRVYQMKLLLDYHVYREGVFDDGSGL